MGALSDTERVAAGLGVRVSVSGYSQAATGAALREARSHVRAYASFGVLFEQFYPPELVRRGGAAYWAGSLCGETWRAAGREFTVAELRQRLAAVYREAGGEGSCAVAVETLDESGALDALQSATDLADPRAGGGAARAVQFADQATNAVGSTLEGVAGAARGVGDAAAGFGSGAQSVGSVARAAPLLTFAVVTAVALAFAWKAAGR